MDVGVGKQEGYHFKAKTEVIMLIVYCEVPASVAIRACDPSKAGPRQWEVNSEELREIFREPAVQERLAKHCDPAHPLILESPDPSWGHIVTLLRRPPKRSPDEETLIEKVLSMTPEERVVRTSALGCRYEPHTFLLRAPQDDPRIEPIYKEAMARAANLTAIAERELQERLAKEKEEKAREDAKTREGIPSLPEFPSGSLDPSFARIANKILCLHKTTEEEERWYKEFLLHADHERKKAKKKPISKKKTR